MKDPRVIKKYPNRRLYDTTDSRYITLCDIRQLVVDGERFAVIDKKSGEDITRSILLHVIAEQEERGESVMSEDFLARIIRADSGEMPQMVRGYLEETLSLFLEQQQKIGDSIGDVSGIDAFEALTDVAQRNLGQWLERQKQLLQTFHPASSVRAGGSSSSRNPAERDDNP
jgi:polyhydroxyalkanoate synthesis repressor PhaR